MDSCYLKSPRRVSPQPACQERLARIGHCQYSAVVRGRKRCTSPCCWGYSSPCPPPSGMLVVLGFSRSLRLQMLWAAPRYSPVMWQWSRTQSPSKGLSREASKNWALSIQRSCSREKEMYFSVLLGIQLTLPSTFGDASGFGV